MTIRFRIAGSIQTVDTILHLNNLIPVSGPVYNIIDGNEKECDVSLLIEDTFNFVDECKSADLHIYQLISFHEMPVIAQMAFSQEQLSYIDEFTFWRNVRNGELISEYADDKFTWDSKKETWK